MAFVKQTLWVACLCLVFQLKVEAQSSTPADTLDINNGQAIVEAGIKLYDDGEYEKSIEVFQHVHPCSPDYGWACYEMAMSYSALGKYSQTLTKINEAKGLGYENPELYTLEGNTLDECGRVLEGIAVIKTALKRWPNNSGLLYNLGVCYLSNHQPELAEQVLMESIRINPYHNNSHLGLARANYAMGRLAQSYLAYNMWVMLNPRISRVIDFEKIITQSVDSAYQYVAKPYETGVNAQKWNELKWYLQSEMAFKSDFDYPYKVNSLISRQSLMLFRKMNFEAADTSLYNQLYVRLFKDMYNSGWFETYTCYMMRNTDKEDVKKYLEANDKKVNEFIDFIRQYLNTGRNYGFNVAQEQKGAANYQFDDNGKLIGIGQYSVVGKDIVKQGSWLAIAKEGYIAEKGYYENNNKQGEYFYLYDNGQVRQHLNFKDGKYDGVLKLYYRNGNLQAVYNMKDGANNGLEQHYAISGKLLSQYNYVDDKLEGDATYITLDDHLSMKYRFLNDTLSGPITKEWFNGREQLKANYSKGDYDGLYVSHFKNGTVQDSGMYKNGYQSGKWVSYHPNGKKRVDVFYNDLAQAEGIKVTYLYNGTREMEIKGLIKGVLTGTRTEYFEDGSKSLVFTYNQDVLQKIESYRANGQLLFSVSVAADNSIPLKLFYPDGIIQTQGNYVNDKKEGLWRGFNPHGLPTYELNYKDGMQSGSQKYYFTSGQVKQAFECDSDNIEGDFISYFRNGVVETKCHYTKGKLNGLWQHYNAAGQLVSEAFYADNELVGKRIEYGEGGKKERELFYNDDNEETRVIYFNEKGDVAIDKTFVNGIDTVIVRNSNGSKLLDYVIENHRFAGDFHRYYPNGKIELVRHFNAGWQDGVEQYFTPQGGVISEVPYVMGDINGVSNTFLNGFKSTSSNVILDQTDGIFTDYHYNGKVYRTIQYDNDQRHGYTHYFSPDGTLMCKVLFYNGVMKSYTYQDAAGKLVPEIPITAQTNQISCFYPNGKPSLKVAMKNGYYDGLFQCYFPDGKVLIEANFKDDDFNGKRRFYYPSGKVYIDMNYVDDELNGTYTEYDELGNKLKEGQYNMGVMTGEWRYFGTGGKLKEIFYYSNGNPYDYKQIK